jgi:hypothetical protein
MKRSFSNITAGLVKDYESARGIYDSAGLNEELKQNALNSMATALQLQSVALENEYRALNIELAKRELNTKFKVE